MAPVQTMCDRKPTILIAGAGVGGLGLALFLSKSEKYKVQLFERGTELKPALGGHYGLNGALDCLDRAGFHDLWVPLYHPVEKLKVRWGKSCGQVDIDVKHILKETDFEGKFGAFMRGEFQNALAQALPEGMLQCGKEIVHVEELGGAVRVDFSDGTSASGDLLFGADGIRSKVRQQVFGDISLVYSGIKVWWMVTDDTPPQHLQSSIVEIRSANALTFSVTAGAEKKQVILIAQHAPEPSPDEVRQEGSLEVFHQLCKDHGAYDEGIITEDRVRNARLMHFGLYEMPSGQSREQWFQGRVCLLGDAIHATTPFMGQGANQAMQSAYCLARLLEERDIQDYQAIFEEYHIIREPPTTSIISTSGAVGRLRVPRATDGCFAGLKRCLFYSFPKLFPSVYGKVMARQFSIKV